MEQSNENLVLDLVPISTFSTPVSCRDQSVDSFAGGLIQAECQGPWTSRYL